MNLPPAMLETDPSPPPVDLGEPPSNGPALLRQRGSNHVGLRQFNERVVLQALRTHGSLAKAEMARVTGLTAQTIGLITARLDEDQLLRREAPVRGRVGQPTLRCAIDGSTARLSRLNAAGEARSKTPRLCPACSRPTPVRRAAERCV